MKMEMNWNLEQLNNDIFALYDYLSSKSDEELKNGKKTLDFAIECISNEDESEEKIYEFLRDGKYKKDILTTYLLTQEYIDDFCERNFKEKFKPEPSIAEVLFTIDNISITLEEIKDLFD